jgi:hypothetical protein
VDLLQLLDAAETAMLASVRLDALRQLGTDAGNLQQLGSVCVIQVDPVRKDLAAYQLCRPCAPGKVAADVDREKAECNRQQNRQGGLG